jgi:hypothetical protein
MAMPGRTPYGPSVSIPPRSSPVIWRTPQRGAVSEYASSNVPFYDSKFNRVLVTIERPDERSRVYAYLKDSLLGVHVPEPDEEGRIDIGLDQNRNQNAAVGIRKVLDREWPESAGWISIEPTSGPL